MSGAVLLPAKSVTQLTALKRAAANLDPSTLNDLYQHLRALRSTAGIKSKTSAPEVALAVEEQTLYEALASAVARTLQAKKPLPLGVFRRSAPIYPQFRSAVALAVEQHRHWFPKMSRVQDVSMLRLYAELIVNHMRSDGHQHGLGWRSVCWALENLPVVVDQHFPGYAAAGLLSVIAEMRIKSPK